MSEPFMPVNQQDVIDFYVTNTDAKIVDVAARFRLKPAQVSAILAIHGIKTRRGLGNITAEARAIGAAKRRDKALRNRVRALVEEHGQDFLIEMINDVSNEVTEEHDLAA